MLRIRNGPVRRSCTSASHGRPSRLRDDITQQADAGVRVAIGCGRGTTAVLTTLRRPARHPVQERVHRVGADPPLGQGAGDVVGQGRHAGGEVGELQRGDLGRARSEPAVGEVGLQRGVGLHAALRDGLREQRRGEHLRDRADLDDGLGREGRVVGAAVAEVAAPPVPAHADDRTGDRLPRDRGADDAIDDRSQRIGLLADRRDARRGRARVASLDAVLSRNEAGRQGQAERETGRQSRRTGTGGQTHLDPLAYRSARRPRRRCLDHHRALADAVGGRLREFLVYAEGGWRTRAPRTKKTRPASTGRAQRIHCRPGFPDRQNPKKNQARPACWATSVAKSGPSSFSMPSPSA